jgi:uncharacterized membrane protein
MHEMARHRPTSAKRQRERKLAERRNEKAARRLERKHQQQDHRTVIDGLDPDIADIVPGPQPLQAWWTEE